MMRGVLNGRVLGPVVAALVVAALLLVPMIASADPSGSTAHKDKIDELSFNQQMRKLWEDHIVWTRMVIVSVAADLPDFGPAAARLLRNQSDIGNAVKPFYGDAAGDQLTALLRDHILIAADLLAAAKAGDTAAFDDAKTRWYANADDIATFLSAANPKNWPLAEMKMMMKEHLDGTLQEASARLAGNWDADIAAYDAVHVQILGMADMLAEGIIKQFPDRFK